MELRLLDAAREVLRNGWLFYERQGQGLGDCFLDAVEADVQSLTRYGGIHLQIDGFHRMLIRRFPFALYYVMEATSIDSYAILDCRRDSIWIRGRLGATRPSP